MKTKGELTARSCVLGSGILGYGLWRDGSKPLRPFARESLAKTPNARTRNPRRQATA